MQKKKEKEDIKKVKEIAARREIPPLQIIRPIEDIDNHKGSYNKNIKEKLFGLDPIDGIQRFYISKSFIDIEHKDDINKIITTTGTYEENIGKLSITTKIFNKDTRESRTTTVIYEENTDKLKINTTQQINQEPEKKQKKPENKEKFKIGGVFAAQSHKNLNQFIITHNLQKLMILVIDIYFTRYQVNNLEYPEAEKYMTTAANGILTILKKEMEKLHRKKIEYAVIISSEDFGLVYSQGKDKISKKIYCKKPATGILPLTPVILAFKRDTNNKPSSIINTARMIKGRVYDEE